MELSSSSECLSAYLSAHPSVEILPVCRASLHLTAPSQEVVKPNTSASLQRLQSSTHASWGLDDIIWVKRLKMFVLWHFYLKMATYIFKVCSFVMLCILYWQKLYILQILCDIKISFSEIRIRKSFIAKCVCTHKEFVLVLGASSTETIQYKQTTVQTETTYN